jgi:hypothetical protein
MHMMGNMIMHTKGLTGRYSPSTWMAARKHKTQDSLQAEFACVQDHFFE